MPQLGSSLALLSRHTVAFSGATEKFWRCLRYEKGDVPVHGNAENCFLVCRTPSGVYLVTQVGDGFVEDRPVYSWCRLLDRWSERLSLKSGTQALNLCPSLPKHQVAFLGEPLRRELDSAEHLIKFRDLFHNCRTVHSQRHLRSSCQRRSLKSGTHLLAHIQ